MNDQINKSGVLETVPVLTLYDSDRKLVSRTGEIGVARFIADWCEDPANDYPKLLALEPTGPMVFKVVLGRGVVGGFEDWRVLRLEVTIEQLLKDPDELPDLAEPPNYTNLEGWGSLLDLEWERRRARLDQEVTDASVAVAFAAQDFANRHGLLVGNVLDHLETLSEDELGEVPEKPIPPAADPLRDPTTLEDWDMLIKEEIALSQGYLSGSAHVFVSLEHMTRIAEFAAAHGFDPEGVKRQLEAHAEA